MIIKKSFIGFFVIVLIFNTDLTLGQVNYLFDDFESQVTGQQLACQDSLDWTTFLGNPCDPVEDPIISTNYSLSGTKSVMIVQNNDLVKPFGALTVGLGYISFWTYIPEGKSGYFNTLAVFNPPTNYDWAMECYFDVGGSGRLTNVPGQTITFTYPVGFWFKIILYVDFDQTPTQATLKINNSTILTWDWTQSGTVIDQLAASDFFGASATDEMYIDNYAFIPLPLTIPPLLAPTNLTAVEIFNPYPQVQLNWQDNSNYEYAFNILRKHGPLFGAGLLEPIGTAPVNATVYIDSTVVIDSTYTYSVIAYNEFEFSDTITFATIHVVIPVELVSFSYEITGQNDVTLSWITATETNNQGFEIGRSQMLNDKVRTEWERIGFVEGKGTTTEIQHYSYKDKDVNPGRYQYKLKQIDYDGTFEYSDIVEAEITSVNEYSLSQNYPNPFNPSTKIKFTIPSVIASGAKQSQLVVLKVYDILGNEVATLVNEELSAGEYEVEFDASSGIRNLVSGIYFYKLKAGDFIQTKKMIYLK